MLREIEEMNKKEFYENASEIDDDSIIHNNTTITELDLDSITVYS